MTGLRSSFRCWMSFTESDKTTFVNKHCTTNYNDIFDDVKFKHNKAFPVKKGEQTFVKVIYKMRRYVML